MRLSQMFEFVFNELARIFLLIFFLGILIIPIKAAFDITVFLWSEGWEYWKSRKQKKPEKKTEKKPEIIPANLDAISGDFMKIDLELRKLEWSAFKTVEGEIGIGVVDFTKPETDKLLKVFLIEYSRDFYLKHGKNVFDFDVTDKSKLKFRRGKAPYRTIQLGQRSKDETDVSLPPPFPNIDDFCEWYLKRSTTVLREREAGVKRGRVKPVTTTNDGSRQRSPKPTAFNPKPKELPKISSGLTPNQPKIPIQKSVADKKMGIKEGDYYIIEIGEDDDEECCWSSNSTLDIKDRKY